MNIYAQLSVHDTDAELYAELARFAGTQTLNGIEWVELKLDGGRKIVFYPARKES